VGIRLAVGALVLTGAAAPGRATEPAASRIFELLSNHKPPIIISVGSLDVTTDAAITEGLENPISKRFKHYSNYGRMKRVRVLNSNGDSLISKSSTETKTAIVKIWLVEPSLPQVVVSGLELEFDSEKMLVDTTRPGSAKKVKSWPEPDVKVAKVQLLDAEGRELQLIKSGDEYEIEISWILIWADRRGGVTGAAKSEASAD
jgi:hypothetical protein